MLIKVIIQLTRNQITSLRYKTKSKRSNYNNEYTIKNIIYNNSVLQYTNSNKNRKFARKISNSHHVNDCIKSDMNRNRKEKIKNGTMHNNNDDNRDSPGLGGTLLVGL